MLFLLIEDIIFSKTFLFSLCEKGCDYEGTNFDTSMISCSCPVQLPSLSEADKLTETQGAGDWKKRLKEGNIECIKCFNLVFSWKYIKKNAGLFIVLSLYIFQISSLLHFLFTSGFKHIYAFLNQFTYQVNNLGNPPKKKSSSNVVFNKIGLNKNNQIYKDDSNEEEDEEYEEDEKIKSYSINSSSNQHSSDVSQSITSNSNSESKEEKNPNEVRHTFYSSRNNFTHKKKSENDESSDKDSPSLIIRKNHSRGTNGSKSEKLKMYNTKGVHLKNEKLDMKTSTNINVNSTQTLQRKEYIEPEDAEVESFMIRDLFQDSGGEYVKEK